jgi:hypothetical protein
MASRRGTCDKRVLPSARTVRDVRLQYLTRNIGPFEGSVAWRDDQERPLRRSPGHFAQSTAGSMAPCTTHAAAAAAAPPGASSSFTLNMATR